MTTDVTTCRFSPDASGISPTRSRALLWCLGLDDRAQPRHEQRADEELERVLDEERREQKRGRRLRRACPRREDRANL